MTVTPFAAPRRYSAQPSVTRRLFRYAWVFAALAATPTLASAATPDDEMAQMHAACAKLHADMEAMSEDGADTMDESLLSDEQRQMHRMCMSMSHDAGGDGEGEGQL